ncbi:hypothetical protein MFLO_15703 [Listeria floridensis FSL S10-1187]|uniref:C2H2-type domain-containing protein n=1 Tax=Listeria floridensis FSL S10-1187 TaxID=1265817 RepID=A0ABP3AWM3_9LIST|nr:hypothetical protein MFLO_15703 [Listeria floridensis FSL S10-1187]
MNAEKNECVYCERGFVNEPLIEEHKGERMDEWSSADFVVDIEGSTLYASGTCSGRIKINYCPICGRKLEGDE